MFCIACHTTHVLHCIYYAFCIADITTIYTPHRIVITLYRPICLYTSITSPLDDYRHDPMITGLMTILKDDKCINIFLLLTCLSISTAYDILHIYPYYMISPVQYDVLPIIIMLVLLLYILLPPSFYHSLGRFLTTLGLHAQVGDPSYRIVRSSIGVT